ncbi:hypothetical protein K501DRAFT_273307 [Backusella circina FSU 941]|nr:hypothetical protein K501DRAFT_273307 [Backusella circina FSU 941]
MSFNFIYNDDQGNGFDENGGAMDFEDGPDPYQLEDLSSFTDYLKAREMEETASGSDNAPQKQQPKIQKERASKKTGPPKFQATDGLKAKAVHMVDIYPKNNATTVAKELNVNPKNVQR